MKIKIKSDLTAPRCRRLQSGFLSVIERDADIQLDLSHVAEMDSCGMQLLLSLRNELRNRGGELSITERSPAVTAWMDFFFGGQL